MCDWNAIIDISWPITTSITEYKDRKTVVITQTKVFEQDRVRESIITMHTHTGTHVDAPAHFLKDGVHSDTIHLSRLMGACAVLDLSECDQKIEKNDLLNFSFAENDIVLLKTKNSLISPDALFNTQFIYLAACAAEYLVSRKIKAIGIDYLGIERNQPNHETHKLFMEANIPIIEGVRLAHVQPDRYQFICLPLALFSIEAAPARAVLIPFKE